MTATFCNHVSDWYHCLHLAACFRLQEHKAPAEAQTGREEGGSRHKGDHQEAERWEDQQEGEGREDSLEKERGKLDKNYSWYNFIVLNSINSDWPVKIMKTVRRK